MGKRAQAITNQMPRKERRDVSESEQKSESATSMGEHQKDEAGVLLLENGSPWRP